MSSVAVGSAKGRGVFDGSKIVLEGTSSSSVEGDVKGCGVAGRGVEGLGVAGLVGVAGGGELVARAAAGKDALALAFRLASSCSVSICLNNSLNFFERECSPTSAR